MSAPINSNPDYDKLIRFFNQSVKITEKAASSKDFCKLLLNSLYEIFGFKTSSFWLCDEITSTYFLASHRIDNQVSKNFYLENPLYAENLKDKYDIIGDRNVITITDIMSLEEYESSQYFKEYLTTEDPYYYTTLMLIKGKMSVKGAIAFIKTRSEGDFLPSDLSNLDIISTFISNLVLNHLLVNNLLSQKCLLESLSNQSPTGLIIFNDQSPFHINYINSAALRYTRELCPASPNAGSGEDFLTRYILGAENYSKYTASTTLQSPSGKKYILTLTPSQTLNKYATMVYAYIIPQVETALKKDTLFTINNKNITQRQLEIIVLVIQGKTNEEIADELFISVNTVKTHLNNIYRELNVSNRFSLYSKLIDN